MCSQKAHCIMQLHHSLANEQCLKLEGWQVHHSVRCQKRSRPLFLTFSSNQIELVMVQGAVGIRSSHTKSSLSTLKITVSSCSTSTGNIASQSSCNRCADSAYIRVSECCTQTTPTPLIFNPKTVMATTLLIRREQSQKVACFAWVGTLSVTNHVLY